MDIKMKLELKNSNWIIFVVIFFLAIAMCLVLPFLYTYKSPNSYPLGIVTIFLFCFYIFCICIKSLSVFTFRLSVTDTEMHVYKWFWFWAKKTVIKKTDVAKLEVTYGVMSKGQLHFNLVNNKERITVDLNSINQIEGELVDVKLSQYAPSDLKIKLTLSVAKTISTKMKIPFSTIYVDDA